MQSTGSRVQWVGGGILVALALFAFSRILRTGPNESRTTVAEADPEFQVDVLAQEAATPGKVLHIDANGSEVLTYTCRPEDAAIAVFTMRRKKLGTDLVPQVSDGVDPNGRRYLVSVVSENTPPADSNHQIHLVSLRRGFTSVPSTVSVPIHNGSVVSKRSATILFTKIAPPLRVVSPPTPEEAAAAERLAKVTMDDTNGIIVATPNEKLPKGEFDNLSILATSFEPFDQRSATDGLYLGPYASGIDAVKVRVDRMRVVESTSTLTYRNAKLVKLNGKTFVWLPESQDVGEVMGHKVKMGNRLPPTRSGPSAVATPSNDELDMQWNERRTGNPASTGQMPLQGITLGPAAQPRLSLLGVSPTVDAMGLNSLKVWLPSGGFGHQLIFGFDTTVHAEHPPQPSGGSTIPELRFRVGLSVPTVISTRILVLPVRHFRGSSGSRAALAQTIDMDPTATPAKPHPDQKPLQPMPPPQ